MRLLPPLLLIALAPLAACSSSRPTDADEPAADVDTTEELVSYLGRRGFVLRPVTLTVPSALDVAGQVYEVQNSGLVAVYEFDSPEAAERGAEAFQLDALGGGTATLYQRGPLVVAYSGGRSALQLTLTQALGPAVY